jgi:hypothetical protein
VERRRSGAQPPERRPSEALRAPLGDMPHTQRPHPRLPREPGRKEGAAVPIVFLWGKSSQHFLSLLITFLEENARKGPRRGLCQPVRFPLALPI